MEIPKTEESVIPETTNSSLVNLSKLDKTETKSKDMEPVVVKLETDIQLVDSMPSTVDMSDMSLDDVIKFNKFKERIGQQTVKERRKERKTERKKKRAEKRKQHQPKIQIPSKPVRLLIKNLDSGVTDQDIYDLFSECGEITESTVHYDRLGNSLGTAHINFKRYIDGVKGQRKFHGMTLDGRPMVIRVERISNIEKEQYSNMNTSVPTKRKRKKNVKRLQRGSLAIGSCSQYSRPLVNTQNVAKPLNVAMGHRISNQYSMGFANPGYGLGLQPLKSENMFGSINGMNSMGGSALLGRISPNIKNRIAYSVMDRINYGPTDNLKHRFLGNVGGAGPITGLIQKNVRAFHNSFGFSLLPRGNIGGQQLAQGPTVVMGNHQQYGMHKQQPKQQRKKNRKQQQGQGAKNQQGGAQKGKKQNVPNKQKKKKKQKSKTLTAEQLDKEMDEYRKSIHLG